MQLDGSELDEADLGEFMEGGEEKESSMSSASSTRQRKALKKAPDAPKRFSSAYIFYVQASHASGQHGSFKATGKIASDWNNLRPDEKAPFEAMAEADKARYHAEMASYSGPMQVPNTRKRKDPTAPKRAMSAYLNYSPENRALVHAENPNLKNSDVSKVLGARWHLASESERAPHVEKEKRHRDAYYEELRVWNVQKETRAKEKSAAVAAAVQKARLLRLAQEEENATQARAPSEAISSSSNRSLFFSNRILGSLNESEEDSNDGTESIQKVGENALLHNNQKKICEARAASDSAATGVLRAFSESDNSAPTNLVAAEPTTPDQSTAQSSSDGSDPGFSDKFHRKLTALVSFLDGASEPLDGHLRQYAEREKMVDPDASTALTTNATNTEENASDARLTDTVRASIHSSFSSLTTTTTTGSASSTSTNSDSAAAASTDDGPPQTTYNVW